MNTNEVIRNFIVSELMRNQHDELLGDEDPLIESGIIDSMGVMSLLAFLEKEFSIEIPGDDLLPENFASITAVAALVERQRTR